MKNGKLLLGIFVLIGFTLGGCSTTKNGTANNSTGDRYALVIGIGNYQNIGKIPNPKNDAEDVSNVLKQLGYNVELCIDATYDQLEIAVDRYVKNLSNDNNTEGFFYFAGQGVSAKNRNYILPVDFSVDTSAGSFSKAYPMDALFVKLIKADNATNIIIADACFTELQLTQTPTHRGTGLLIRNGIDQSSNDGLDILGQFTKDIFYVQSALPGKTASDGGSNRNSPFTQALLKNIAKPIPFTELVQEVTKDTKELSGGQQEPYFRAYILNFENYAIKR